MSNASADSIRLYGAHWCPDCRRAKQFFGEQRIPYQYIDIEKDSAAMALIQQINHGKRIIPTILFPDGSFLVEPSNAELSARLGLRTLASRTFYDAIVIGGGPAGLSASLYMAREGIETLVVEKAGLGGQAGITEKLDNFPGFDEGISGADFARRLGRQAQRFGVEILLAQEVREISAEDPYLCITTGDGACYTSKVVLLASGARYRRLNVPGENELIGINIHFCATCDGAFYRGKKLLVIGGGNSGFEEGLFLTRFASQVDIVDHNQQSKASKILQEKVAEMSNMQVIFQHEVKEFRGEGKLDSVIVEDKSTGELKTWNYDGVFVFIGLSPNSDLVKGKVELDPYGFIKTDVRMMSTLPGLFAAGDVRAGSTKQAASAAGEGVSAALMIRQYLNEIG